MRALERRSRALEELKGVLQSVPQRRAEQTRENAEKVLERLRSIRPLIWGDYYKELVDQCEQVLREQGAQEFYKRVKDIKKAFESIIALSRWGDVEGRETAALIDGVVAAFREGGERLEKVVKTIKLYSENFHLLSLNDPRVAELREEIRKAIREGREVEVGERLERARRRAALTINRFYEEQGVEKRVGESADEREIEEFLRLSGLNPDYQQIPAVIQHSALIGMLTDERAREMGERAREFFQRGMWGLGILAAYASYVIEAGCEEEVAGWEEIKEQIKNEDLIEEVSSQVARMEAALQDRYEEQVKGRLEKVEDEEFKALVEGLVERDAETAALALDCWFMFRSRRGRIKEILRNERERAALLRVLWVAERVRRENRDRDVLYFVEKAQSAGSAQEALLNLSLATTVSASLRYAERVARVMRIDRRAELREAIRRAKEGEEEALLRWSERFAEEVAKKLERPLAFRLRERVEGSREERRKKAKEMLERVRAAFVRRMRNGDVEGAFRLLEYLIETRVLPASTVKAVELAIRDGEARSAQALMQTIREFIQLKAANRRFLASARERARRIREMLAQVEGWETMLPPATARQRRAESSIENELRSHIEKFKEHVRKREMESIEREYEEIQRLVDMRERERGRERRGERKEEAVGERVRRQATALQKVARMIAQAERGRFEFYLSDLIGAVGGPRIEGDYAWRETESQAQAAMRARNEEEAVRAYRRALWVFASGIERMVNDRIGHKGRGGAGETAARLFEWAYLSAAGLPTRERWKRERAGKVLEALGEVATLAAGIEGIGESIGTFKDEMVRVIRALREYAQGRAEWRAVEGALEDLRDAVENTHLLETASMTGMAAVGGIAAGVAAGSAALGFTAFGIASASLISGEQAHEEYVAEGMVRPTTALTIALDLAPGVGGLVGKIGGRVGGMLGRGIAIGEVAGLSVLSASGAWATASALLQQDWKHALIAGTGTALGVYATRTSIRALRRMRETVRHTPQAHAQETIPRLPAGRGAAEEAARRAQRAGGETVTVRRYNLQSAEFRDAVASGRIEVEDLPPAVRQWVEGRMRGKPPKRSLRVAIREGEEIAEVEREVRNGRLAFEHLYREINEAGWIRVVEEGAVEELVEFGRLRGLERLPPLFIQYLRKRGVVELRSISGRRAEYLNVNSFASLDLADYLRWLGRERGNEALLQAAERTRGWEVGIEELRVRGGVERRAQRVERDAREIAEKVERDIEELAWKVALSEEGAVPLREDSILAQILREEGVVAEGRIDKERFLEIYQSGRLAERYMENLAKRAGIEEGELMAELERRTGAEIDELIKEGERSLRIGGLRGAAIRGYVAERLRRVRALWERVLRRRGSIKREMAERLRRAREMQERIASTLSLPLRRGATAEAVAQAQQRLRELFRRLPSLKEINLANKESVRRAYAHLIEYTQRALRAVGRTGRVMRERAMAGLIWFYEHGGKALAGSRERIRELVRRLREKGEEAVERAREQRVRLREAVRRRGERVGEVMRERRERVREVVRETRERIRERARRVGGEVRERARRVGEEIREGGRRIEERMRERAREVRERVREVRERRARITLEGKNAEEVFELLEEGITVEELAKRGLKGELLEFLRTVADEKGVVRGERRMWEELYARYKSDEALLQQAKEIEKAEEVINKRIYEARERVLNAYYSPQSQLEGTVLDSGMPRDYAFWEALRQEGIIEEGGINVAKFVKSHRSGALFYRYLENWAKRNGIDEKTLFQNVIKRQEALIETARNLLNQRSSTMRGAGLDALAKVEEELQRLRTYLHQRGGLRELEERVGNLLERTRNLIRRHVRREEGVREEVRGEREEAQAREREEVREKEVRREVKEVERAEGRAQRREAREYASVARIERFINKSEEDLQQLFTLLGRPIRREGLRRGVREVARRARGEEVLIEMERLNISDELKEFLREKGYVRRVREGGREIEAVDLERVFENMPSVREYALWRARENEAMREGIEGLWREYEKVFRKREGWVQARAQLLGIPREMVARALRFMRNPAAAIREVWAAAKEQAGIEIARGREELREMYIDLIRRSLEVGRRSLRKKLVAFLIDYARLLEMQGEKEMAASVIASVRRYARGPLQRWEIRRLGQRLGEGRIMRTSDLAERLMADYFRLLRESLRRPQGWGLAATGGLRALRMIRHPLALLSPVLLYTVKRMAVRIGPRAYIYLRALSLVAASVGKTTAGLFAVGVGGYVFGRPLIEAMSRAHTEIAQREERLTEEEFAQDVLGFLNGTTRVGNNIPNTLLLAYIKQRVRESGAQEAEVIREILGEEAWETYKRIREGQERGEAQKRIEALRQVLSMERRLMVVENEEKTLHDGLMALIREGRITAEDGFYAFLALRGRNNIKKILERPDVVTIIKVAAAVRRGKREAKELEELLKKPPEEVVEISGTDSIATLKDTLKETLKNKEVKNKEAKNLQFFEVINGKEENFVAFLRNYVKGVDKEGIKRVLRRDFGVVVVEEEKPPSNAVVVINVRVRSEDGKIERILRLAFLPGKKQSKKQEGQ